MNLNKINGRKVKQERKKERKKEQRREKRENRKEKEKIIFKRKFIGCSGKTHRNPISQLHILIKFYLNSFW